jgi:hypothetical protein
MLWASGVAFVWAAATAARRQTNIDVNVILKATQYRQNPLWGFRSNF